MSKSISSKLKGPKGDSVWHLSNKCTELLITHINKNDHVLSTSSITLLWHNRLGHLTLHEMKHKQLRLNQNDKMDLPCSICPMTRQLKPPFPKSFISSKQCFDKIHLGP